jgi:predicted negative regulator of RcsB-dependent stress response
MNQRLSRRDMKRDELVATLEKGVDYAQHHTRGILIGMVAVAGVGALGLAGWLWWQDRREDANQLLARAIQAAQAPLDPAAAKPDDPRRPSFPDEAARRARAVELLAELRAEYGGTGAAAAGSIYLAGLELEAGDVEEAGRLFAEAGGEGEHDLMQATAWLAGLRAGREQGKGEEAVAALRAALAAGDHPLPGDVLLHELGATLEALGRGEEARAAYQRIVDEFPRSPYQGLARERAQPAAAPPA